MKRAALAVAGTAAGLAAVLSYKTPPDALVPAATAAGTTTAATTTAGATTRTLTGDAVSTRWGPVQVAVVLEGDRITAVQVLQQPDSNARDRQIGAYALPVLEQETLDQQSADVDVVSGATYTSEGYRTSLQSALDQR